MNRPDVSVIIPALNEESAIADSVASALKAGASEIIVVDGGSEDATIENATQAGATQVITSLPGRGAQLAAGAELAAGPWLLFLHADNCLGPDCLQQISSVPDADWGAFCQSIEHTGQVYRWLEWGNAKRVLWRRMPFGDQAVFVRQSVYKSVGGYRPIPLMEDVDLAKRLRRLSRPQLLPGPVSVDARRWQHRGVIRQTVRNWSIQIAYAFGVSENTLASWYR